MPRTLSAHGVMTVLASVLVTFDGASVGMFASSSSSSRLIWKLDSLKSLH